MAIKNLAPALLLFCALALRTSHAFEEKLCWQIPITNETLFCYAAIEWELSETVFNDQVTRDNQAK